MELWIYFKGIYVKHHRHQEPAGTGQEAISTHRPKGAMGGNGVGMESRGLWKAEGR